MFQEYFRDSEFLSLPLVALILFLGAFVAVVLRAFFGMGGRRGIDRLASLPLNDGPSTLRTKDQTDG